MPTAFLVDRVLTGDLPSVRECLLTRYAMFLRGLYSSKNKELRILSSTASSDVRSTTGSNSAKLTRKTGLDLRTCRKHMVKEGLLKTAVPTEPGCWVRGGPYSLQRRRWSKWTTWSRWCAPALLTRVQWLLGCHWVTIGTPTILWIYSSQAKPQFTNIFELLYCMFCNKL